MARLFAWLTAAVLVLAPAAARADHVDDLIAEATRSPSPFARLRAAVELAKIDDPRAVAARQHLAAKAQRQPLRDLRARSGGAPLVPRQVAPTPSTPASCATGGAGSLRVAC